MALSYELAPNPKWYIADLVGRPLAGGSMYTYRNLDKTEFKYVFQDPAGNFPWTDPILFDENGSQGPFYFQVDSLNPDETYYLEVYDADGVLQWTIDNFIPSGGGGGNVTTALDLENLITNNVYWRNIGATANPIVDTFIKLAPGAHAGFAQTPANAGPDICFIKNNTNATDHITFTNFILGSTPLTGDVTPVDYLNYTCTNAPAGETKKVIQLPVTRSVQNLTNQNVTLTLWARVNSGASTLTLQWFQFFGDGAGASASVITPIQTLNLTSSWQKFIVQDTVPSVTGKVLGACGNDALFVQIQYPLGVACNIDHTKPCLYLGNIAPSEDYSTYDVIDGVINAPRTGDIRTSLNNVYPYGWINMNDGTIGSPTSGATNRANVDTFPLYNLIWGSVNNAWAPVTGGRGADAITDFTANKPIALTRALGRVFAGTLNTDISKSFTADNTTDILTVSSTTGFYTGVPVSVSNSGGSLPSGLTAGITYYAINLSATTLQLATSLANALAGTFVDFTTNGSGTNTIQVTPYQLGQFVGEETHTLTVGELAAHHHSVGAGGQFITTGGGGHNYGTGAETTSDQSVTLDTGSNEAHNIMQPTTYMNVFIKL